MSTHFLKKQGKYYSISTLYNLAHYFINFGVMKEYNIDIDFRINSDFEVIDI